MTITALHPRDTAKGCTRPPTTPGQDLRGRVGIVAPLRHINRPGIVTRLAGQPVIVTGTGRAGTTGHAMYEVVGRAARGAESGRVLHTYVHATELLVLPDPIRAWSCPDLTCEWETPQHPGHVVVCWTVTLPDGTTEHGHDGPAVAAARAVLALGSIQ